MTSSRHDMRLKQGGISDYGIRAKAHTRSVHVLCNKHPWQQRDTDAHISRDGITLGRNNAPYENRPQSNKNETSQSLFPKKWPQMQSVQIDP